MEKKKLGAWFEQSVDEWDISTCWKFLRLSETVQKRLPGFGTAGTAKEAVLAHMQTLIERNQEEEEEEMVAVTQDILDVHETMEVLNVCIHALKVESLIPELESVLPLTTNEIKQKKKLIIELVNQYLQRCT